MAPAYTRVPARTCNGSALDAPGTWAPPADRQASEASFLRYFLAVHNDTSHRYLTRAAKGRQADFEMREKCPRGATGTLPPKHRTWQVDGAPAERFKHQSGCSRLGVFDSLSRLSGSRITFVGDSVFMQLWMAVNLAQQSMGARAEDVDGAVWYCSPKSEAVA